MPDEVRLGEILYRVSQLERQTSNGKSPALLRQELDDVRADVGELKAELKAIRRALWAATGTFAVFVVSLVTLIIQASH